MGRKSAGNMIAKAAPKLAPLDAPSIKGSTSGFLKQP